MSRLVVPGRLVLLVEDSLVNQKLMALLLRNEGCDLVFAADGKEAVDIFQTQPFDLILMDIQMPVMDGLEATRLMRHLELDSSRHTPIVAVTAGMDRESCLAAGMDDHVQKPLRVEMLRQLLSQIPCHA